jgi:hypothetical protein
MSRYLKIILFQLIIISQITNCQSIVRSSLSCLGSTFLDNGLLVRQTLGQSSNTLLFSNGGIELRQGFQQPIASFHPIKAILPMDFTLSPNPASDRTLLELKEEYFQYTITIRNISGIVLAEFKDESSQSKWLEFHNNKPGIYLVTVTCGKRRGLKKLIITH